MQSSFLLSIGCSLFRSLKRPHWLSGPGSRSEPSVRRVAGLSQWRPSFGPRPYHVRFVVDKLALGQVSLPVLRFFPTIIIPPMLHTHLHPNTATIRRTSGQNFGTVQKNSAQRSTVDSRKSVPRGGLTFNLFDFRVKFPHKKKCKLNYSVQDLQNLLILKHFIYKYWLYKHDIITLILHA